MMNTSLFLVYGKGWIGSKLCKILEQSGEQFQVANSRMEDRESVIKEIENIRPTHVLLAAGVTGRPNVDWCEDHKVETVRSNVIGCLNLFDVCHLYDLHVTYFATGCIYHYDEHIPEGSSEGFKESDEANFLGSFYSRTKVMVEDLVSVYSNILTLRLRLPITEDLISDKRNLVSKILSYEKVVSIKNSMTVLPELLPLSIQMAKQKKTGVVNFTNPGCISHNEILEMYREYIDPAFSWKNFTVEEQARILKAPRSNAFLDTSQLESMLPFVLPIKDSLKKYVFAPAQERKEEIMKAVRSLRH